jgi:hypothetical protein
MRLARKRLLALRCARRLASEVSIRSGLVMAAFVVGLHGFRLDKFPRDEIRRIFE